MYMYTTRLGTIFRFLQFLGGEIVPITIITFLILNSGSFSELVSIKFIYFSLLSIFIYATFFTLYEIGYIFNDCISTKHEQEPSMRYRDTDQWKYLVASKLAFFVILLTIATLIFQINAYLLIAYGSVTMALFLLHNKLPFHDRGFSYFWLESMRLMILPFLMLINSNEIMIMLLIISPELLRRTLRYLRIKYLSNDRKFSTFDLKVILLSVCMICIFFLQFNLSLIPIVLTGYSILITGIIFSIALKR